MSEKSPEYRVALVTGGTSGLGRAAAIQFGRQGCRVVIAGRNVDRGGEAVSEVEAVGAQCEFVETDVGDSSSIVRLVETTVERFGRIDCAFNNAAEAGAAKALADCDEADFDRAVAVNLKSVWLCMKLEIEQMLKQEPKGGAIVNTASVNALGGVPGASLYAMTKAGVVALSKSAALEYAAHGIRVNVLVPGAFRTSMMDGVIDRMSGDDPEKREQVEQMIRGYIALGRLGRPEEAAEAVTWLCSDAASYVTGQSFIIDGGMTAAYR